VTSYQVHTKCPQLTLRLMLGLGQYLYVIQPNQSQHIHRPPVLEVLMLSVKCEYDGLPRRDAQYAECYSSVE
jgi:hypothetical protein